MADDPKVSRLEYLIAWLRRWGRFAGIARAAAAGPLGRRIVLVLLAPVVLLVVVVVAIVRVVGG